MHVGTVVKPFVRVVWGLALPYLVMVRFVLMIRPPRFFGLRFWRLKSHECWLWTRAENTEMAI